MCRSSSLRAGRRSDRYLHEYAECRAEFGRVVPVARLILPATLMEYTLVFRVKLLCCATWAIFSSQESKPVASSGISIWNLCLSGFGAQPPSRSATDLGL